MTKGSRPHSATDLTKFQIEVARAFFQLKESVGFVVSGGAALLAAGLITRPTEDLDLFTHAPTDSVLPAKESFLESAGVHGWDVSVIREYPTFCRLVVLGRDEEVLVDLAVDSPPADPPTMTILGPTLAPLELAGRKVLALFGRAEARDFADVYALAERFGAEALLVQATEQDRGFSRSLFAEMIATLDRFTDDEIPAPPSDLRKIRTFFADWATQITGDHP
ncbi:nucleotidyl transferase AbiEii/AbiGii toxin family protein [Nocardia sp. CA-290969]|uniref:nucleotidyl transferase AbiEii/AbiGii toxin family protein n=1 Tax=Nocardia sp. CA-290969 TaxID=3239986 RepID=UPI003D93CBF3